MVIFDDKIEEINFLLERSRKKWHLDAVQWMDYDDVCQIIRIHISKKWHLWDQARKFGPWCNRVISHQISNLIRNNYSSFQKPCLKCPHYTSDTGCALTESKTQDTSCEIFAKWTKKKRNVHDIRLPLSIENQVIDQSVSFQNEFDYEYSINRLHFETLKRIECDDLRDVYKMIFIDEIDDDTIKAKGKVFNDLTESLKKKKLESLKKQFYDLAKSAVYEEDVF